VYQKGIFTSVYQHNGVHIFKSVLKWFHKAILTSYAMEVDFDYVQPVLEKRKPAIKINGYSMFAEWTDPDS
jgi:hypothetical protein